MIKTAELAERLLALRDKAAASELTYRRVLARLAEASEKALYIYFWQEHAKMVSELEERVRWLNGSRPQLIPPSWGGIEFASETAPWELIAALRECALQDADLLQAYQLLEKSPIPAEVTTLLRLHSLKLKSMQARVYEKLANVHTTTTAVGSTFHLAPSV